MPRVFLKENVLEAARARISRLFDEFPQVLVSFSGGKDSTVVLNLALEEARRRKRLPLPVLWLDQEAEWECVVDYARSVFASPEVQPYWFQGPFKLFNATTTGADPWLHCWEPGREWVRPKEANSIHYNPVKTDRFHKLFRDLTMHWFGQQPLAQLGGVRCEESPARMNGLTCYATFKDITWGSVSDQKARHFKFYPIYDWSYCCTGEAPIWMGDYSFRRLDTVRVGDVIIGFTVSKDGMKSRLIRTNVEALAVRRARVVKIRMSSGRMIRCTADHQWQKLESSVSTGPWKFGSVKEGDVLGLVVNPVNEPVSVESAWLGGIYDGEGSGDCISQSSVVNPDVFDRICQTLTSLGLPFTVNDGRGAGNRKSASDDIRLLGGRSTLIRFAQAARPVRLRSIDDLILSTRFRTRDRIISITPDGEDLVYSMQTSAGTYVAWGYASKNCDVWKAIHEHGWRYCTLYDKMYQYGIQVRDMRVSNLHHETAVKNLRFVQEVEPATWGKITSRIGCLNAVKHVLEGYTVPESLPAMFTSWREYRDHLLAHLITEQDIRDKFTKQFAAWDRLFNIEDPRVNEDVVKLGISALLVNDYEGTKYQTFVVTHARDMRNHGARKGALGVRR